MPSTVSGVLSAAGLSIGGRVSWGTSVPERNPGVYVVTLPDDAKASPAPFDECPISRGAVVQLLEVCPGLRLDGQRPDADALVERVSAFWLPDEVILYIGLAGTSLRTRVRQYYGTPLGAAKPHAGGWFLQLLYNIESLHVRFAPCPNPKEAEATMLGAFCANVSSESEKKLHDADHSFPFANLEWPAGTRKQHGITGAKADTPRQRAASGTRYAASTPRVIG